MPNLLRSSKPTARKAHRCYTCKTSIDPGTSYGREVYLGDDGLYEWVNCIPCSGILPEVFAWAGNPHEGVVDEDYWEWAHEHRGHEQLGEQARAFLTRLGCKCETCAAPARSVSGEGSA